MNLTLKMNFAPVVSYTFVTPYGDKIDFEGYFAVIVGCQAPPKDKESNTSNSAQNNTYDSNSSYTPSGFTAIGANTTPNFSRLSDVGLSLNNCF